MNPPEAVRLINHEIPAEMQQSLSFNIPLDCPGQYDPHAVLCERFYVDSVLVRQFICKFREKKSMCKHCQLHHGFSIR